MELLEALYTTRAMRRMQPRDVPDEVIPRLLDAAIRAPSGGGFQNWCFIVIRDAGMKAYLGKLFDGDIVAARAGRYRGLGSVPVGSLARHQAEIFPRLGVPADEGWMLASIVALGYPTGRWAVAPRKPAHEVTFVERFGQRPAWTISKPLWPNDV